MLAEYALVPDIFDSTCYSVAEVCSVHLQYLKEPLLHEALVRDLRDGGWRAYIEQEIQRWDPRAKELIKKLIEQHRLRRFRRVKDCDPSNYTEWCVEAIASHDEDALTGIIAADTTARQFLESDLVSSIERLATARWWHQRSSSVRLLRNTSEYLRHLDLILKHANSIMFIDPHLDPGRYSYREFSGLLRAARRNDVSPFIEIHRVCYESSGRDREFPSWKELEERFRAAFGTLVEVIGLGVDVFIWDDFHDRYLITDIIGISVPSGFDITGDPTAMTTWTRLGRTDRDDVQREFDPSANRHKLHHRFRLGS